MAVLAPVFPVRTPISAPANSIVPFTRAAPLPSGAPSALAGQPPLPPRMAPLPSSTSAIIPRGVPINAPNLAPAAGVAIAPAAEVATTVGGASLLGVLGGAAAGVLADLVFPAAAAAPEAPGVDPSLSPLIQPGRVLPTISSPSEGIRSNAIYRITIVFQDLFNSGATGAPIQIFVDEAGSNVISRVQVTNAQYPETFSTGRRVLLSMTIVLKTPGAAAPVVPNYAPYLTPQGPGQLLQNPVPVDVNGERKPRVFIPPPVSPQIVPFTRPATRPANPPQPAPQVAPSVPPSIVPDIVPPVVPIAPPISPPFPFPGVPIYPYPVPFNPYPPTREKNPFAPLAPIAPGLTVTPSVTPPRIPFTPDVPVEETGKLKTPWIEPSVPPIVPPTKRQRGADCCDDGGGGSQEDCCEEILEELAKLKKCACPDDRELATQGLGSGDSISASLPDDTIRVSVQVTDVSSKVRTQSGNEEGETVYFLGWYAFGRDDKWDDRKPISHLYSEFCAPKRANMFTFTLVFGSSASATATYLLPSD